MAHAKKKPRIKDNLCVSPARNLTVTEGSISSSVDVDFVEKSSLDSVSCGSVSCGHSDAQQYQPCSVGPAINFTVSEGSISCSVQFDSVKNVSLSVSCVSVVCGRSGAHGINNQQISTKTTQKMCTGSSFKKGGPKKQQNQQNGYR
jgi:hypothetical protein